MIINSSHANTYFYGKKRLLLIHPCLSAFLSGDNDIQRETRFLFDEELIEYYSKKYLFLKSNGFLSEQVSQKYDGNFIEEIQVIDNIKTLKTISIEVTEKCNMKCEYCAYSDLYIQYGTKREGVSINENAVYILFSLLSKYWDIDSRKLEISFYGGEPLLAITQIKNIINHIEKIYPNIRFDYKMTTNGLLLKKHIGYLVEHNFSISISLDGNEEQNIYRRLNNGLSSHNLVVQNINFILEKYPDFYKNRVHISSVLHNLNSIVTIQTYFRNKFNLFSYIASLNPNNVKNTDKMDSMYKRKGDNFSLFSVDGKKTDKKRPNEKEMRLFIYDILNLKYKTLYELVCKKYVRVPAQKTCIPFSRELFFTAKGEIYPCETIARAYPLGKILDDQNVEFSPYQMAKLYNDKIKEYQKHCSSCYVAEFCFYCIFQIAPSADTKIRCPVYHDEVQFGKFFENFIDYFELYTDEYYSCLL